MAGTKTPGADSILQSRPSLLYLKVIKTLEFQGVYLVIDTDRNFVAKYSQQVLHFDHEVTY